MAIPKAINFLVFVESEPLAVLALCSLSKAFMVSGMGSPSFFTVLVRSLWFFNNPLSSLLYFGYTFLSIMESVSL